MNVTLKVKPPLQLNTTGIKTYIEVAVKLHAFLTSTLAGLSISNRAPASLTSNEEPIYPLIEGMVGCRVSMEALEKEQALSCRKWKNPDTSVIYPVPQSLYRMR